MNLSRTSTMLQRNDTTELLYRVDEAKQRKKELTLGPSASQEEYQEYFKKMDDL